MRSPNNSKRDRDLVGCVLLTTLLATRIYLYWGTHHQELTHPTDRFNLILSEIALLINSLTQEGAERQLILSEIALIECIDVKSAIEI